MSDHARLRSIASGQVIKLTNRGLASFSKRLQAALDLDTCALRSVERGLTGSMPAAERTAERLRELSILATETLYELTDDRIYETSGDVHIGVHAYTPDAAKRKLLELRVAIDKAIEARNVNRSLVAKALEPQPMVTVN